MTRECVCCVRLNDCHDAAESRDGCVRISSKSTIKHKLHKQQVVEVVYIDRCCVSDVHSGLAGNSSY